MVVTCRVPSPRSVRHLLQVASVSANVVVGKRVLYYVIVKLAYTGDGGLPRVRRRGESLLVRAPQHSSERLRIVHATAPRGIVMGRRPNAQAIAAEFE